MTSARRLLCGSNWTRVLLGALGLTLFGLLISAFLAAILGAAGDAIGNRTFSAFNLGLASFAVAECVALIAVIAIRMELQPAE
jgi:hypothetical protein